MSIFTAFICGDTLADKRQQEKPSEISVSQEFRDVLGATTVVTLQMTSRWHHCTTAAHPIG